MLTILVLLSNKITFRLGRRLESNNNYNPNKIRSRFKRIKFVTFLTPAYPKKKKKN
jgi:hypothetical protein